MEVIIVALIVSLISPAFLAYLTGRQRSEDRKAAWAREDLVAEKVALTAKNLVKTNSVLNTKLDTIHTLVNSNMTAAMQSELSANIAQLALMREMSNLKGDLSEDSKEAIKLLETKVSELRFTINDRTQNTGI